MMPWKDQLRLGWSAIRWTFWPKEQPVWANTADLIVALAVIVAIGAQLWLAAAIGIVLWFAIALVPKKKGN
jgi:hypothetical protein